MGFSWAGVRTKEKKLVKGAGEGNIVTCSRIEAWKRDRFNSCESGYPRELPVMTKATSK